MIWFCLGLILSLLSQPGRAAELTWFTDLAQAQSQANAEKKTVLLLFHGSGWCPPCVELERQVINSPEFIAFAREALVLVDVDFPEKTGQSEALKRANLALKAKFNTGDNYPTIVLLNESGETVFQEAGYGGGGPKAVLPQIERHAKRPATTAGFKDLGVAEFARRAADKENVILDVRTKREFDGGHIPGAINLDVTSPDFDKQIATLDRSKIYLVHCASGVRSAKACDKLSKLDFSQLYNLPAGFRGWVKAGEPVEK